MFRNISYFEFGYQFSMLDLCQQKVRKKSQDSTVPY